MPIKFTFMVLLQHLDLYGGTIVPDYSDLEFFQPSKMHVKH